MMAAPETMTAPKTSADGAALNQAFRLATSALQSVNPALGLLRFGGFGLATMAGFAWAWHSPNGWGFVLGCLLGSLFYSFWIICIHDAAHGTLTGWRWFDAIAPRLISWPILVAHGTYSELHKLHHAWNAKDLRDPERVQWSAAEYAAAGPLGRIRARHQWIMNALVLGHLALLSKTFQQGWQLREELPALRRQMAWDIAGMVFAQGTVGLVLLRAQSSLVTWLHYGVMLLILERVMSLVIQARDYLEHYGCWQDQDNHRLTQLYGTRNIKTYRWVNWTMGGLPHHGIHHAFPGIPFHQLPQAQQRIEQILSDRQYPPLPSCDGYFAGSWKMMRQGPKLIP